MDIQRIHPEMYISEQGELFVKPKIVKFIRGTLCKIIKCSLEDMYATLERNSRVKINTSESYFPQLFSVPKSVVKEYARSLNLVSVPGLYTDLDLDSGKYEGGFKVWESSVDLVRFISQDLRFLPPLLRRPGIRVLELGAGASLPSLALLSRLIQLPIINSSYSIHLQDYNWQVLASLSILNFAANLPHDYLKALIKQKSLRLFHGDWSNFRKNSYFNYDLIMMSEVLYNADNYRALHSLLDRCLSADGLILIATKCTYFGLSGGVRSWLDFTEICGKFTAVKIFNDRKKNIPRSILIMKRSMLT